MERYIISRCDAGQRNFVVDLAECGGLDSTFMGMLMGAAKRVMKVSGCLQIINAAGRNAQLLRGLGVHYFCNVAEDSGGLELPNKPVLEAAAVPHQCLSKGEQKSHCLNAHVELVESCDANKSKFGDVVQLMKSESGASSPLPSPGIGGEPVAYRN
jgi:anti-sigma B factor antagonist